MAAKDYKKTENKASANNVAPFPVNTLEAYQLAAGTLEAEIWNLIVPEIDADFPTDWVVGILERVKTEIQELDYEE